MAAHSALKPFASLVLLSWLALLPGPEPTAGQQSAAIQAEPATVEEAARVLDLRTFPRMTGDQVSNLLSLGMLMYSAKGTPKEAFEFQQKELTKLGFKELPGGYSSAATYYSHFTKDGFSVAVSSSEVTGDAAKAGWSQVSLINSGNVALDKLPVPPGVKPFHPSPREASYTTAAPLLETAAACRKLLLAAGWEPYGQANTGADSSMQDFKRNAIKLQSWVSTTPAEGGKTLIRYSTELMSADLPAPPDTADPRYDDWQKKLWFESPEAQTDAIIAFYQQRLPKQGWQPTTERPIVDEKKGTRFLIYRNPNKDMLSLDLLNYAGKVATTLKHQTAAEVAEEERKADEAAERARQELAARNAPVKFAFPLPAGAQKLTKKGAHELEFSLPTGSGPAALENLRAHLRQEGWTEKQGRDFDKTSGVVIFEKGYARLTCSYFDIGFGDVDVTVSGTQNVVLEPAQSKDATQAAPQAASKPAAAPLIPGLPALPPGVELPDEVKSLLNKALQDAGKKKAAPAPPPAKKPTPAKAPPAAKAPAPSKSVAAAVPTAPPVKTFQRIVTEKSLGSVSDLDLSQRDPNKPTFWVSPDGRRFAYLIEKQGIVIDGQTYNYPHMYRGGVKEGTFRFSPDSKRTAYVVFVEKQGETLVLDGVPEKVGWNFIDHKGAVFSRDSQHVAYIARRYVGGGVEYALMIDGKEREVFKESPAWSLSFTADGSRVVWGEDVGGKTQMRETSVDGSQPRIEHQHGPALMTVNFFFGGGGQMGYVAREAPEKQFIFYDGKDDSLRFREIKQLLLSADGKHMAYVAEPSSFRNVVVKDGKPSKEYGGLDADYIKGSLTLSPDGNRWAYAIKNRNNHQAVIDGKEGKPYRAVAGLTFSPDSKRVAYRAVLGNKLLIVVDGQEGPGYDELGLPVFSPDGKSVAVGAGTGKSKFIVLNRQNRKTFGEVGEPVFSPDSKRLVYEAEVEAGGQSLLIDTGKESRFYDDVKDQVYFSDDSRHLAAVVVDGDHQMVVVNGVEGNAYDRVITLGGGGVFFDASDRIHYLATKGQELFLVEEAFQP